MISPKDINPDAKTLGDKNTALKHLLWLKKEDIENAPLANPEGPLKIIGLIEKDIGTQVRTVVTTLGVIKTRKTRGTLILQRAERKGSCNHGLWTLPGGRLQDGFNPEDEVVREIKEETKLDAIVTRELGTFLNIERRGVDYVRIIHAFEARVDSYSGLELSSEHAAWKFYFPKDRGTILFDGVCDKVLRVSACKKP